MGRIMRSSPQRSPSHGQSVRLEALTQFDAVAFLNSALAVHSPPLLLFATPEARRPRLFRRNFDGGLGPFSQPRGHLQYWKFYIVKYGIVISFAGVWGR